MKNKSQKLYSKIIATALLAGTVLLPTTAGASVSTTTTKQAVTNNAVASLPGLVTVASGDTSSLDTTKITFVNNVGKTDEIKGPAGIVPSKAAVKIYASSADTVEIAKGTASADGSFTAKGANAVLPSVEATLYITTKVGTGTESAKTPFNYTSDNFEKTTTAPTGDIVVENTLKKDIVTVKGLTKNDVVKVYAHDERTLLGTAKAVNPKGVTAITPGVAEAKVTLKVNLSDDLSQKIWVSVTSYESSKYRESELVEVSLADSAEPVTSAPTANVIVVTNNLAPVADTVKVTEVVVKDTVKVYAVAPGRIDVLLGSAVVAKDKTEVDVKLKTQLPDGASLHVTVTKPDHKESNPTPVSIPEVTQTSAPTAIITIDDKFKAVTVKKEDLSIGAIINIYANDGRTLLAKSTKATADKADKKLPADTKVTLTLVFPKVEGEYIYVSVTEPGRQESLLTKYTYNGTDFVIAPE